MQMTGRYNCLTDVESLWVENYRDAGAECTALAIVRGILSAGSLGSLMAFKDLENL